MGFLSNIGQIAAGGTDAAGLASRATGLGSISTGLDVTGDLLQGIGGLQEGRFAAAVARQNAQSAFTAGGYEESASKLKYGALEASQKAAQGANGIAVSSGSPAAVRAATSSIGALDAAMIHYNAARGAYAQTVQAGLDARAGTNALAKGALAAGKDFISGSASLADKWLSYRRDFPTGG